MALIKYSAMISEIKGKLNGSIFSNPSYGAQMRNRRCGGGKNSSVWSNQKSTLAFIASQWKTLTEAQQLTFASRAVAYPYVNKFGDSVVPSAYQLFCTLNLNLFVLDRTILTSCSAPYAEADFSPVVMQVSASGTLEMTYTNPSNSNVYALYYVSPAQSPGVFYPPSNLRFVGAVIGNTASPYAIESAMEAIFPPVADGQKYFWRMEVVDTRSGQRYGNYSGSLVVSGHA